MARALLATILSSSGGRRDTPRGRGSASEYRWHESCLRLRDPSGAEYDEGNPNRDSRRARVNARAALQSAVGRGRVLQAGPSNRALYRRQELANVPWF